MALTLWCVIIIYAARGEASYQYDKVNHCVSTNIIGREYINVSIVDNESNHDSIENPFQDTDSPPCNEKHTQQVSRKLRIFSMIYFCACSVSKVSL